MIKLEYLLAEGSSLSITTADGGTFSFPISKRLRRDIAIAVHNDIVGEVEEILGFAMSKVGAEASGIELYPEAHRLEVSGEVGGVQPLRPESLD